MALASDSEHPSTAQRVGRLVRAVAGGGHNPYRDFTAHERALLTSVAAVDSECRQWGEWRAPGPPHSPSIPRDRGRRLGVGVLALDQWERWLPEVLAEGELRVESARHAAFLQEALDAAYPPLSLERAAYVARLLYYSGYRVAGPQVPGERRQVRTYLRSGPQPGMWT